MLLPTTCLFALVATVAAAATKNAPAGPVLKEMKWGSSVIPMKIDTQHFDGDVETVGWALRDAIHNIELKTCLRFPPAVDSTSQWVTVTHSYNSSGACVYDEHKKALSLEYCDMNGVEDRLARLIGFEDTGVPLSPMSNEMFAAINKVYKCPDYYNPFTSRLPYDRAIAKPSLDPEHSHYIFWIDKTTMDYAKRIGKAYGWLAINQICGIHKSTLRKDTQNWNFTEFRAEDWKREKQYDVVVNRCKKGGSRFPDRYRGFLCGSPDEKTCDTMCEIRELTISDNGGPPVSHPPKAVFLVDELPWVCQEMVVPFRKDQGFGPAYERRYP